MIFLDSNRMLDDNGDVIHYKGGLLNPNGDAVVMERITPQSVIGLFHNNTVFHSVQTLLLPRPVSSSHFAFVKGMLPAKYNVDNPIWRLQVLRFAWLRCTLNRGNILFWYNDKILYFPVNDTTLWKEDLPEDVYSRLEGGHLASSGKFRSYELSGDLIHDLENALTMCGQHRKVIYL